MGKRAGSAYGLGAWLGLASFQASRVPKGPLINGALVDLIDEALKQAREHANALTSAGLRVIGTAEIDRLIRIVRPAPLVSGDPHGLQEPIEALRGDIRNWLHAKSSYGGVYDLAVEISVAEGQASVAGGDPAAGRIATNCIRNAQAIARHFASVIDVGRINGITTADHPSIQFVRVHYGRAFSRTSQM